MGDRTDKAKETAREMQKREKEFQKQMPTLEDARILVEKKRALEKQKSEATRKVVDLKKSPPPTPSKPKPKTSQKKKTSPTKKPTSQTKKPPIKKNTSHLTHTKKGRKAHLATQKKQKTSHKKILISKKNLYIVLAIILFTIITSVIGITLISRSQKNEIFNNSSPYVSVEIADGLNATHIASLLEEIGVIKDAKGFVDYLVSKGDERNLLSGFYNMQKGSSYEEMRTLLTTKPLSSEIRFTIYKGSVIKEIDNRLAASQLIKSGEFITAIEQQRIEKNLHFSEGWIYSDVYTISKGEDVASVLASLSIDRLFDVLKREMGQISQIDYSVDDIIIIASMIQRETQDPLQMADIARVIFNRLERNEPLGIDATTRYALDTWNRDLTKKDFSDSGEYDTRRRVGLPPTGIGSVGLDAIKAALYPADHDYLYYFHDNEGNLHLSLTYQEHKERYNSLK